MAIWLVIYCDYRSAIITGEPVLVLSSFEDICLCDSTDETRPMIWPVVSPMNVQLGVRYCGSAYQNVGDRR